MKSGITPIAAPLTAGASADDMGSYRLHYMDPSGKFIRADRINSTSDPDAVEVAYDRKLPVRSELWFGGRLIAKFPPRRLS